MQPQISSAEFTGSVPVLIYLSKDDHASPQPPPPITLQVPRSSLILAVDPYIRAELLSPDFGASTPEYLRLSCRSCCRAVDSKASLLAWQDPIGVCVDVLSARVTDAKITDRLGSSLIPAASLLSGSELNTLLRMSDPDGCGPVGPSDRDLLNVASLLDMASVSYYGVARTVRVEEGIFPLKLTVSVSTEVPQVPRILWLSGNRKPPGRGATVGSNDGTRSPLPGGELFLPLPTMIPQPSQEMLRWLMQMLKQSSQSLFGSIKRFLNCPPGDAEILRRIPLIAKTLSVSNALSEEQYAQQALLGGGSYPNQSSTPQQLLSRGAATADICDAVNTGKFTNFASAMGWMCEQRNKMEGVGGVCEGIPIVLHWACDVGAGPLYSSTPVTVPNPVRGSSFSVSVSSYEGLSFTLEDALRYAMAQIVAKDSGHGTWLEGDRRKAAGKVCLPKGRATTAGDDEEDGPNPAHYKSALPQPISQKLLSKASNSPDGLGKVGLKWLNAFLLDAYKLDRITTDNYFDDSELENRRAEALRDAVHYHEKLYGKSCELVWSMSGNGSSLGPLVREALMPLSSTGTTGDAGLTKCDSLVSVVKEGEACQLVRALALVEAMALCQWKEDVLALADEVAGDGRAPPKMPYIDILRPLILGRGSPLSLPAVHSAMPRILINGIEPSLATPFLWCYEKMGGSDMRLHITIVMPAGLRP